jgi:hypothetical protein
MLSLEIVQFFMTQTSDYETSKTSFINTYNQFTRFLIRSTNLITLIHYSPKAYFFFPFLFWPMLLKTAHSVSDRELTRFVENSGLVKFWLRKSSSRPKEDWLSSSRRDKARILCRFFKWLRIEKDVDLTPRELMERHRKFRLSKDSTVEKMQWLLNLALEHSRDNPDFVGMHAIANRCAMNESE